MPPKSNAGPSDKPSAPKKRRVGGTCDLCKRRKIRCDSTTMPGNRCTNCITAELECTHSQTNKDQNWDQAKGYIESLEQRLVKMEGLLQKLSPEIPSLQDVEQPSASNTSIPTQASSSYGPSLSSFISNSMTPSNEPLPSPASDVGVDILPRNDDDTIPNALTGGTLRLTLRSPQNVFFGKASGAMLIRTALDLKDEYTGGQQSTQESCLAARRPNFWNAQPWEHPISSKSPCYTFPEADLMTDLINRYFSDVNIFMPLLHRPTLENAIKDGQHLREPAFGATVLAVCALGSKYSDDPRVFFDGTDDPHSRGWKWFNQVDLLAKILYTPPSLYELQLHSLSALFLLSSAGPLGCWTVVGIGLRRAQEVGVHRRKVYENPHTNEEELWKRAFWSLISMDRIISPVLGRPCAVQDDDYDLDFPCDCDDEYWENPDPEMAFKQPPGRPSIISFFIASLKLQILLGQALRTLYAVTKPNTSTSHPGKYSDQIIVAELDSEMHKWMDAVPDHLRWDPDRENRVFFNQSSLLYTSYYHLQILIHRPFIPSPRNPSQNAFPALAICTNAARSCCHVLDVQNRRNAQIVPFMQVSAITAGVLLLLNIWSGQRSGLRFDPTRDLERVDVCLKSFKLCEQRWRSAGRLWDLLSGLRLAGESAFSKGPAAGNKRSRENEGDVDMNDGRTPVPSGSIDNRQTQGSRRVSTMSTQRPTFQGKEGPIFEQELGNLVMYKSANEGHGDSSVFSQDWLANLPSAQQSPFPPNTMTTPNATHTQPSVEPSENLPAYFSEEFVPDFFGSIEDPPNGNSSQNELGLSAGMALSHDAYSHNNNAPPLDNDLWANAPYSFGYQDWGDYMAQFTQSNSDVYREPDR